jgi:hypothetical protein
MSNTAKITRAAQVIRTTFEKLPDDPATDGYLGEFPLGCTDSTSVILGLYLIGEELGLFRVVSGRNTENRTHTWLQQGALIVDICHDMFGSGLPTVFVSEDSTWHSQFDTNGDSLFNLRTIADYNHYISKHPWTNRKFMRVVNALRVGSN